MRRCCRYRNDDVVCSIARELQYFQLLRSAHGDLSGAHITGQQQAIQCLNFPTAYGVRRTFCNVTMTTFASSTEFLSQMLCSRPPEKLGLSTFNSTRRVMTHKHSSASKVTRQVTAPVKNSNLYRKPCDVSGDATESMRSVRNVFAGLESACLQRRANMAIFGHMWPNSFQSVT